KAIAEGPQEQNCSPRAIDATRSSVSRLIALTTSPARSEVASPSARQRLRYSGPTPSPWETAMQLETAELFGVAAAAASLYAAQSRTMIPLRWAALAANALAMVYSFMHGTYPTFALNLVLFPVNAWRLRAMIGLVHDLDASIKGDLNADWLLPYTRPR